jgi:hypothetical protein
MPQSLRRSAAWGVDELLERTAGQRSRDLNCVQLHFRRLPGTRLEGEHIAGMLKVRPWLEDHALEARFKAARSPCLLYLATHDFFLEDQPRDPNHEYRDLGAVSVQRVGPGPATGVTAGDSPAALGADAGWRQYIPGGWHSS